MATNTTPADTNPVDLTFRFDSGRLCLNVVASVGGRSKERLERWPEPEDLGRWCVESGLLEEAPSVTSSELVAARALREAIYRLVQAAREERQAAHEDISLLNEWAARASLVPELAPNGRHLFWRAEAPLQAVLASVARDAVDLMAGELIGRIRECAEDSCSVLFIDASRPGKRRWCSMNRCGNRVKKQAFRKRQRAAEAST
ncbi:ABATE domain-containing protein [Pelagibius sp. Alg239-R121]|uniref:CGNR zinc finger domain-containing protein n=1 Tax=Pelagibius sp. Alg239-R121 TaxID=2993448 RepID=UPI0024A6412E|nr:ABATE domain-containing protein [Pelagibius sp. Alg239-R121]